MSVSLLKIAAVMDAAAAHLDALEQEKVSAARAARSASIDALAAKYAAATGEELPAPVRAKIAESDKDVIALIESMASKQAGEIESLGGSADLNDDRIPRTVKEAAEDADARFLNWTISG